jgi:hypothetical protein
MKYSMPSGRKMVPGSNPNPTPNPALNSGSYYQPFVPTMLVGTNKMNVIYGGKRRKASRKVRSTRRKVRSIRRKVRSTRRH